MNNGFDTINTVIFDLQGVFGRFRQAMSSDEIPFPEIFEPYDEVVAEALRLKYEGYRTAVLSNFDSTWFCSRIAKLNLEETIDVCCFADQLGFSKPDKRSFLAALKQIGVHAHETIFFDDSPANVSSAKTIGIRAFLVEKPSDVLQVTGRLLPSL